MQRGIAGGIARIQRKPASHEFLERHHVVIATGAKPPLGSECVTRVAEVGFDRLHTLLA